MRHRWLPAASVPRNHSATSHIFTPVIIDHEQPDIQLSVQPVTGDKSVLDETDECLFVHTFRNSSNTGGWSRSVS